MHRFVPGTTRHRLSAGLAALLVLASLAVVSTAAADDLKHKKRQVQRSLSATKGDLEESSAQLRAASAALTAAQTQLVSAQDHLAATQGELAAAEVLDQQMQAKLDTAVAELKAARRDLETSRRKIVHEQDTLGRIVVANYQTGDPALMGLSMVLTSQDPTELTGQLNSVQNIMDKESVVLDRLEASKVLLTVQEDQVQAAKKRVATQRAAAAANLVRKQQLEQQAVAAELAVRDLVSARSRAQSDAESARLADLAHLQSLQKQQDQISALLAKRAEEARQRALAAAAAAGTTVAPVHGNGYLDYPVDGPITSPFGVRIHPIYHTRGLHDGIDLAAGCGTPIKAPAAGTVLQEYRDTVWGNRLVLDMGFRRGAGIAAIMNHMSGYAVPAGAHVKRGEVLGYIGSTGWSTGCHLHFTVLENGVAVNPLLWL